MGNVTYTIRLVSVEGLSWKGCPIPAFLPLHDNETHVCGAVVYWSDMPEGLQLHFQKWLEMRQLSIGMPPSGLLRPGRKYFLDDVLTALEYTNAHNC